MNKGYLTVSKEVENLIVIERSKFICNIKGIVDEFDAKKYIEQLRKKHSLATHSCYAYIADEKGLVQKFSDAGEPQGTAGLPMLEVLKNKKIYKTVAVVTRYFGGIKLGTGGLTRAYSGSVSAGLELAKIIDVQPIIKINIKPEYDQYSKLLKLLTSPFVAIENTDFTDLINVNIVVKEEFVQSFCIKLSDTFNGKIKFTLGEKGYFAF